MYETSDMDGVYCLRPDLIRDDSLDCWRTIGSGGFGQIYRARHTEWKIDVAIKSLLCDGGSVSTLQREASLMFQGGNPNVLRVFGLYEGHLGNAQTPPRFGLVMEFMERGSLAGLLQNLGRPPAWPLTFRIIHQIGLGMNFLHQLSPPLLHLDLKPSNVLLDDSLNAKLTDFGLSRVARSLSKCVRENDEMEGGTLSYMPPEALKSLSYKPSKASDIYSYGVLLWSIITGQEPYSCAASSLVRFRVPEGDRPDVSSLDCGQTDGLPDTVELMKRCWVKEPSERPSFKECVDVTEKIFEMHKRGVSKAVNDVLKTLDDEICSSLKSIHITSQHQNEVGPQMSSCVTGSDPKQETAADHTRELKKTEPGFHLTAGKEKKLLKTPQRQTSTPGVSISMSNVYGVQIGNGNYMNIVPKPRRRHRTAPSSVNGTQKHS